MKEKFKQIFADLQNFFLDKPSKKREMSSILTFLFSILGKDKKLNNLILEDFKIHPEIYPSIISYLNNPNCQCKANVRAFIQENLEEGTNIFLNIIDKEHDEKIFEELTTGCELFHKNLFDDEYKLYGKIIQIKNSKEEYLKTLKKFNEDPRFKYKGLHIIKSDDDSFLDLYFY